MFYSEVLTPFTLWLSAALYSQGKARNGPLGSTTGSELFPQGFYACVSSCDGPASISRDVGKRLGR